MNAFAALLATALVAFAAAGPCADICNGSCDTVQASVALAFPPAGAVVKPHVDICKSTCDAVCTCTDACNTQCTPDFDTCVAAAQAAYNPVGVAACQTQYLVCSGPCNFQCSGPVISGVVQQVQTTFNTVTQSVAGLFQQFIPQVAPAP